MNKTSTLNDLALRLGVPLQAAQEIYAFGEKQAEMRAVGVQVRPRAKDLIINFDTYRAAFEKGLSLSAYLEEVDPSAQYNDGLDAFERQLSLANIRVRSDVVNGRPADRVERFWSSEKPGSEALFPEFLARTWRQAALADFSGEQVRFYQSSVPVSEVLYPAFIQQTIRMKQIQPAIPLSALIALVTSIDSDTYRAFYLTDATDEYTMKRVAEGAEVPTAQLTGAEHTTKMKKYGRRLLASYEAIRRTPIDRLALHLSLLAIKAEADKVSTALDVAINGDGNSGTAASTHNLTALDSDAVAGELTLKAYLAFRMQWSNPYAMTVMFGRTTEVLQCLMLNTGSANASFLSLIGNFGIGGFSPINNGLAQAGIGWTNDVPASRLVGLDSRFGLEMAMEVGASLTETDRIIRQQFNEIVMTEVVGFNVFDQNANKVLVLDA